MEEINFPDVLYENFLKEINGVKLTRREVEVIAFILSGRSRKKIASLLSISPKTVENHTRNIMNKLDCNSREQIIDLIEKSGKLLPIKQYYLNWLIHTEFENVLKSLSLLSEELTCSIVYWPLERDGKVLLPHLRSHLKLAGVKVTYDIRQKQQPLSTLLSEFTKGTYKLYLLPKYILEEALRPSISNPTVSHKNSHAKIFILPPQIRCQEFPPELLGCNFIEFTQTKNYYLLVYEIFQKLYVKHPIEGIIRDSQEKMAVLSSKSHAEEELFQTHAKKSTRSQKIQVKRIVQRWFTNKSYNTVFIVLCLVFGSLWGHNHYVQFTNLNKQDHFKNEERKSIVRADLIVPTDSILLERNELIAQIESKFNKHPGVIQTVALTGIGGSGKTTLARQYARLQTASIIWEINAESLESLKESFEKLAYACSQTDEERNVLRSIKEIKNLKEKDEKILLHVKKYLKGHPHWLLIYDNVDKASDIRKYFPFDCVTWGKGKIIITTQGLNMEDNIYPNTSVRIEELNADEKLALFLNIMQQEKGINSKPIQIDVAQKFLEAIPSYPLDVTVASYYLKETNVSYDEYLCRLTKCDQYFDKIQKKIIEEVTGYKKSRYGILALSLQKIIESHEEFKELLVLVSLINSQNIPRNLLNSYKSEEIVDNFIFHIKKYFFMPLNIDPQVSHSNLSVHRSIQATGLKYLTKALNLNSNSQIIKQSARALENYIINKIDQQDYSEMEHLKNHCEAFLRQTHLLNDNIYGMIGSKLGVIYFYIGEGQKSKEFLEQTLQKYKKYFDQNYNQHAWVLGYLGLLYYREFGEYEKAQSMLEQSLTIYKKNKAKNHINVGRSLLYLGLIYAKIGKYEPARNLFEKSLLIHKQHYAKDHFNVAFSLVCLGSAHCDLGNYDIAKGMLEESLIIYRKHFPETHLNIAWLLVYLGNVYKNLGDYNKARLILEQSIKTYKDLFSEDYVDTARILVLLAHTHSKLGNYVKAINILERCLKIYEKQYRKDHIEIADILNKLGEVYLLQGHIETAESLITKSLKIYRNNKHVEIYRCFENLSELYFKRARNQKNLSLFNSLKKQSVLNLQQALEIVEINFPLNSPHKTRIQSRLMQLVNAQHMPYSSSKDYATPRLEEFNPLS
jgi:tetratricopeptide (TPR) repeat protein/DNA-binding CsgD family transcriptional regulator